MKKFNILLLSLVVYSSLSIATEQQKQTVNTANKNIVIATNVEDAEIKVDMASKSSDSNIKNIQEDFDIGTKNGVDKNIKVINVLDVIGDENVSPELRKRVTTTLNKAQYEFDKYESYINNHTKSTDNKFIDVEKELNNLKTFMKNDIDKNQRPDFSFIGLSDQQLLDLSIQYGENVMNLSSNNINGKIQQLET